MKDAADAGRLLPQKIAIYHNASVANGGYGTRQRESGERIHEALWDRVRGVPAAPDGLDAQSTLCRSRKKKKG